MVVGLVRDCLVAGLDGLLRGVHLVDLGLVLLGLESGEDHL